MKEKPVFVLCMNSSLKKKSFHPPPPSPDLELNFPNVHAVTTVFIINSTVVLLLGSR